MRLLARASEAAPLAIALDDVQWLDAAGAELLRYVALHGAGRLLLLLAARTEELPRNTAVARALDEVNRARRLSTVALARFTPRETEALLAFLLGTRDEGMARSLHARSEGNPFLLEETLKALAEGGEEELPRGMVALVERRLGRLSDDAIQLVRAAALLGRRFPLGAVAAVSPREPDRLAALLDETVAEAILLPMPIEADEGAFAHDCIREVILRGLNPVRRRALHLQIARAIEAEPGRPDLARVAALAHHFARGGAHEEAARYAQVAGDEATRQHAYADARDWYGQAMRHAATLDEEGPAQAERLVRHARAAAAAGSYAEAITSLRSATRLFRDHGDARSAGRACRDLGDVLARREEPASAQAAFEEALGLFGDDADSPEHAEVMLRLAGLHGLSTAAYDQAVEVGERALATSMRVRDAALEARARLALANTVLRSGDLAAGGAVLLPAVDLARRVADPDPDVGAEIHGTLANLAYWTADVQGSEAATERRLQLALESGDPYALRHVYLWQANLAYTRGRWDRAEELLATAEPILARLDSPEPRAFQQQIAGLISFQRGDVAAACAQLTAASAAFRRIAPGTLLWYAGCACRAQVAAGLEDEADSSITELDELIDQLPAGALPRGPALAQLGLVAMERGDRDLAARVYPRLLPHAGQHHWVLMDRVLGSLAASRRDWPPAERFLDGAERAARRAGILPELALTTAARAHMLAERRAPGDLPTATALWQRARERFAALGMRRDERRAAAAIEALGHRRQPAELGTLSDRELEVLRLVASGLTNREIAGKLVISERTVNNHLTHILTKTNTGNRAAAASYALRHGLI